MENMFKEYYAQWHQKLEQIENNMKQEVEILEGPGHFRQRGECQGLERASSNF